ncbi:MAG: aminoacyl-tRNA hydrolase, partial [Flavobacteriales bacterium]|nr:aminoacyl-tRNA hydrolase [Flavobacteriales bacterium]
PGKEYQDTRHNIGFWALDQLAEAHDAPFTSGRLADVSTFRLKGKSFLLIKPTTYMNLSGKAVAYWMQKENIDPLHVLVVVDDLALPPGILRLRGQGSDGGHNGLKSITASLGTNSYARLRMGIGNDFSKGGQVDYVLGQWTDQEKPLIKASCKRAGEAITAFALAGLPVAMNQFNG